ncbi:hypothetical protein GXM_09676 [Nostoc sphaeroides CCNUC1]|uniref:Uncharacterized protein n=1 Tax=Nostoc sphaeroides CCNUC1 TaxID=2653204 RepID=A0A5P8WIB7_9NOSO|nr:hypothetical protein GXM_09676 [Nostoc sphaeroides CCNUC1]
MESAAIQGWKGLKLKMHFGLDTCELRGVMLEFENVEITNFLNW